MGGTVFRWNIASGAGAGEYVGRLGRSAGAGGGGGDSARVFRADDDLYLGAAPVRHAGGRADRAADVLQAGTQRPRDDRRRALRDRRSGYGADTTGCDPAGLFGGYGAVAVPDPGAGEAGACLGGAGGAAAGRDSGDRAVEEGAGVGARVWFLWTRVRAGAGGGRGGGAARD